MTKKLIFCLIAAASLLVLLVNARETPAETRGSRTDAPRETTGWQEVGFSELASFDFGARVQDDSEVGPQKRPPASRAIPGRIKALDGRRVCASGFMLPMEARDGLTTEFLLMKSQSLCCFGVYPRDNEWIHVRMSGEGVRAVMDIPVEIQGVLHVGEVPGEDGIYRMDGERRPAHLHHISPFIWMALGVLGIGVAWMNRQELRNWRARRQQRRFEPERAL